MADDEGNKSQNCLYILEHVCLHSLMLGIRYIHDQYDQSQMIIYQNLRICN